MRFLYSVQRYGEEIVGGSETACRQFAENLVDRGHDVTVVTSCALSYVDWADHFDPGESVLNGVKVVRLPVLQPRDPVRFAELSEQILIDPREAGYADQIRWMRKMGPMLRHHDQTLRRCATNADVSVFMTYLYPTTVFGVPSVRDLLPTVLQPTAHDEPHALLPIYRALFQWVDGLLFLTDEERNIARRVFHSRRGGTVTGIGMDTQQKSGDARRFRDGHGLRDDPYILYLGRIDVYKGVSELMRYFVEYKGRNPSNLRLVLAGEQVMPLPEVEDIRFVGFLDERSKIDAIAGSSLLVQSSPFESFSMVLCESWLQRRPVLVQGRSEVMSGQCMRSGGGIPYRGFAEFEAALDRLLGDQGLSAELGENGYDFVMSTYSWEAVMSRYMDEIDSAVEQFSRRKALGVTSLR